MIDMPSRTNAMTRKQNGKSFFTLLEVLISMGVFAILMLALMQFFVSAQAVVEHTSAKATFYDDARIAMNLIANDLACTFYAPEYNANQYTFMSYSSNTNITFATMRSDGLAEVYYSWTSNTLQLNMATLKESANFSEATWVTRPNSTWISTIQGTTPEIIAENVVLFEILLKDNSSNTISTLPATSSPYNKLPRLAEISMTVITKDAIEKLKAMSIVPTDLAAKYKDQSSLTDAQKDILLTGTQTFKRVVLIDRGQYN